MTDSINDNWVGKLQELGQKCRFVPVIDVANAENYSITNPSFKCSVEIKELKIHVESIANSKKSAKTTAAKIAYEKICAKTNVPQSTSIDIIAGHLKQLNVKDDEMTVAANFFQRIKELKLIPKGIDYGELVDMLKKVNCTLKYAHDDNLKTNNPEFRFKCDVRPEGHDYPVISGFGCSSSSKEEAKDKAVDQLRNAINFYSNNACITHK